jgi:hypothetical protein
MVLTQLILYFPLILPYLLCRTFFPSWLDSLFETPGENACAAMSVADFSVDVIDLWKFLRSGWILLFLLSYCFFYLIVSVLHYCNYVSQDINTFFTPTPPPPPHLGPGDTAAAVYYRCSTAVNTNGQAVNTNGHSWFISTGQCDCLCIVFSLSSCLNKWLFVFVVLFFLCFLSSVRQMRLYYPCHCGYFLVVFLLAWKNISL